MRGKTPKDIRHRREQQPLKVRQEGGAKKSRWLDPLNLGLGIAGLVLALLTLALGLKADLAASVDPPLDPTDVLTSQFEISNTGLLDLVNVRVQAFVIAAIYEHAKETNSLATKYVPPAQRLASGETQTVPFRRIVRTNQPMKSIDIALIAFFKPAYMPFWKTKRKALRFVGVREADGKFRLQKQPAGDALQRYDEAIKGLKRLHPNTNVETLENPATLLLAHYQETIELVKRFAGSSHEVVVHDMQKSETATKAKNYGIRSVPAVVIDGKLASCCAGRGPEEHVLRSALA